MQKFVVNEQNKISKILLGKGYSYGVIMSALKKKDIKVNGKRINKDLAVTTGDIIEVYCDQLTIKENYKVIFQDENLFMGSYRIKIKAMIRGALPQAAFPAWVSGLL